MLCLLGNARTAGVSYGTNTASMLKLNRFHAFGLHLLVSIGVALCSAAMVFWVWYPDVLAYASGVDDVFLLLVSVDVILGPIITLIVFNPRKKELRRDLTIVVLVQAAALLYGLSAVFIARPVYLAFNLDRFDVVNANEIRDENLAKAIRPEFRSLPYFGPKIIASPLPDDSKIKDKIMVGTLLGGDDVQQMPQYYLPYTARLADAIKQSKPLDRLKPFNRDKLSEVDALIRKYADRQTEVGYVLLKAKVHDGVVILNRRTGEVLEMRAFRSRNGG